MKHLIVALLVGLSSTLSAQDNPRFPSLSLDSTHKALMEASGTVHATLLPLPAEAAGSGPTNRIELTPRAVIGGGMQTSGPERGLGIGALGVDLTAQLGERWAVGGRLVGAAEVLPTYLNNAVVSGESMPGWGRSYRQGDVSILPYATGYAGFRINSHFYLEGGHGKHFWGDGHRSLVLSHNAAPYTYLRVETSGWHLKYVNLWARLQEYNLDGDGRRETKYMAAHAISWNATKHLHFGLYEMVTWQAKDLLSDRGFELNYLNPIAFYRPIEFAQGSADNVLLAFTWRWRSHRKWVHYGQILVDEFLLKEIRDQSGWWANKFGAQVGFKFLDVAPGFSVQTEVNVARPFTYTHGSVLQNYGHMRSSLAHPLGTNFLEWVSLFQFDKNRWSTHLEYMWAIYGRDSDGDNYGGDIYRSYKAPLRTHFNYLAQGLKSTFHYASLRTSYLAWPEWQGRVALSYAFRYEGNEMVTTKHHLVGLSLTKGIGRQLVSAYRDF